MSEVHFTNLLIVVVIALLAPLALGFFPRIRLPAIVLEIVLGIVVGPSGLGWVKPDLPVSILALIGLAFLLFLSVTGKHDSRRPSPQAQYQSLLRRARALQSPTRTDQARAGRRTETMRAPSRD
jgi:Sodium/hydrogen exchanger family